MKKVLTILAVMLLMTGFAFAIDPVSNTITDSIPQTGASEQHTITVNTWVDVVLPTFNFVVKDRAAVQTNTTDKFDVVDQHTATDTAYIRGDSAEAAIGNDLANSDISEYFEVYSVKKEANIVKAFDFTVAATNFVNDDCTTVGEITYVYTPNNSIAASQHITASAITETNASSETVTTGFKATFNGKQYSDNVLLGTIKVTWPKDVDAKPGAYTANVVLTVKAE